MSTKPLWQELKLLVELDQQKQHIVSHLKKSTDEIEESKRVLPELEKSLERLKQASFNAKKAVDVQERNAKYLKEKESEKRSSLESITKPKEYSAAEKELASMAQQLSEQDDLLMRAWGELEATQKAEATEAGKLEEKKQLILKEIREKELTLIDLQQQIQDFEHKRELQTKNIPSEWLARYEQMHNKVTNPIVPVLNGSCSACYYSVPSQDLARIKQHSLLPCRSCYRILYFDQEEAQDLTKASF